MIKLKVLGSSSKGNSYLLSNNDTTIMLDCGVKKVLEEDLSQIAGIILTHKHGDHSGMVNKIKDYYNYNFYAPQETLDVLLVIDCQKEVVEPGKKFDIGSFTIMPFQLEHDVTCYGYFIKDNISNCKLLYITDTGSINYKFKDIDYFLIESNCDEDILTYEDYKETRLYDTHLSMQQTGKFLKENVNHNTEKVILCHISTSEDDYSKHKKYIEQILGNENIEVIALDPHMQEPLEITLKEDLKQFNFD